MDDKEIVIPERCEDCKHFTDCYERNCMKEKECSSREVGYSHCATCELRD